jgi:hypothetical protein
MKRLGAFVLLLLLLAAGSASAGSIGVGLYGGTAIPVLQDDNGGGAVFGARVPVALIPLITVEPWYASLSGGDKDQDLEDGLGTVTYEGIDVTGFGANVLLTFGGKFQLYPFAGIGSYNLKRTALDQSRTGYNFGLGLGLSPLPKLSLHLRGEMIAAVDGETSRKWATVTAGVTYSVFSIPTP